MTALPDIPRLYTALAECLAVLLFTPALAPRFSKAVTGGITLLWAAGLSAFLELTGNVPGGLWIPCMVTAIGLSYLYLWGVWSITLLEAGYHCARAFILAELAAMDEVLHRQYEQYKRSKEGINLINRRYHELKVQLARIREEQDQTKQNAAIAAMEQNIRQYEAENKTGNPVLDTLLTAKTMECQQENITITSVADGRMLGFLTIRELCTIVGVALDNAIAAVRAEPDPEKRLIKVAVYSQGGFAMLRFEHYTEAAPALDADGLPKQGSDLKSVRTTVGQHGGSMTLHWENNWCTLRILFPLPKNK